MIFGKTKEQKAARSANKRARAEAGIIKFAWFPRRLDDGRFIWLSKYQYRITYVGTDEIWWPLHTYISVLPD